MPHCGQDECWLVTGLDALSLPRVWRSERPPGLSSEYREKQQFELGYDDE
jgi:hypothetical protein